MNLKTEDLRWGMVRVETFFSPTELHLKDTKTGRNLGDSTLNIRFVNCKIPIHKT